jgi:hypothetical protein
MSATPYELRAQLLQQAEGILMTRYQIEHDQIRENLHMKRDKDPMFDVDTVRYPSYPTTEDIIEEAKKLYNFVQTK